MSPSFNIPKKQRIFCNRCKYETNHKCKGEHLIEGLMTSRKDSAFKIFRLWICDGCEQGTLEESVYILDEDSGLPEDEESDEPYQPETWHRISWEYQPARTKLHVERKQFKNLPAKLDNLYREVILALNHEEQVLCAVGIRGLIEGICSDQKAEGKNLEKKINSMEKALPPNIINGLHGIRFLGNDAAHELTSPTIEELRLSVEICEDLLNYLYDLNYKAREMALSQGAKKLFKPKLDE